MYDPTKVIESMETIRVKSAKNRIPLDDFVNIFLPHLAVGDNPDIIGHWVKVAGNGMSAVDVIHPDGTVAYTVPPLFNSVGTRVNSDSRYSASEIITRARRKSDVLPEMGDKFLQQAVPHLLQETGPNIENIKKWNIILTAYGYETIPLKNTSSDRESEDKLMTDDIDGYDEV